MRWVWTHADDYNVDPNRVCALGHSFGGQLAALLGLEESPDAEDAANAPASRRVACVISAAGGIDQTQLLVDAESRDGLARLMGGTFTDVPEKYLDASPLTHVGLDAVPFLVFHSGLDQYVPLVEARSFVDAMHNARAKVIYVEIPDADHLYWFDWETMRPETLAFWERYIPPAQ